MPTNLNERRSRGIRPMLFVIMALFPFTKDSEITVLAKFRIHPEKTNANKKTGNQKSLGLRCGEEAISFIRSDAAVGFCISNLSERILSQYRCPSRSAKTIVLVRHCRGTQVNGNSRESMSPKKRHESGRCLIAEQVVIANRRPVVCLVM